MYARGKSSVHPVLVSYTSKNRLGTNRLGITASTKIGNAIKRNRARRIIKEAYRLLEPRLPKGYDFVFVARSKTTTAKMQDIYNVMLSHLKKAGILE